MLMTDSCQPMLTMLMTDSCEAMLTRFATLLIMLVLLLLLLQILHFDAWTGQQVKQNQSDTRWASWSCTLGLPVMGIWPQGSDGTDINSCDRSPSGKYLLTADDFGKVGQHRRTGLWLLHAED